MVIPSIDVRVSSKSCSANKNQRVSFGGYTSYVTPESIATAVGANSKGVYQAREMVGKVMKNFGDIETKFKNNPFVDVFAFPKGNKVFLNIMPSKINLAQGEAKTVVIASNTDGDSFMPKVFQAAEKVVPGAA